MAKCIVCGTTVSCSCVLKEGMCPSCYYKIKGKK